MSTTFGIRIPSLDVVVPIARRRGVDEDGKAIMWFTEPTGELLPDKLEVIAMDNTPQGIFTIKDIKDRIYGT